MAVLDSTRFCKAALKKGATWHTESDIASGGIYFFATKIAISGGYDDYRPTDVGTGGKRVDQKRLNGKFNVAITCNTTSNQGYMALLASLLATESTPAEQTTGQGDYLRTLDLADTMSVFWTLCWKAETDESRCIPSLKITSVKWACDANGNGTWEIQGICDTFIKGVTNTAAKIDALSQVAYESLMLGGSTAYFRYGAYSVGTALSSSNNLPILSMEFNLSRGLQGQWGLDTANPGLTVEPLQQGDIDASVMFKLPTLNRAQADLMADWQSAAYKMAEVYFSGTVIGTGVARSMKMQFPYMQAPGAVPGGQDVAGNNQFLNPSLSFTLLKAPAAPAGMTGVTDYLRITSIDARSTKFTA
jgi:hypothetical protein